MNTRMEKVAQDVALAVLRSVGAKSDPPLKPEALREAFRARWPVRDSQRPMNDAIAAAAQAAGSCSDQDQDTWTIAISQVWQPAVEAVVQEYLQAARHSFKQGDPLQGVETLTDGRPGPPSDISPPPETGPTMPTKTCTGLPPPWAATAIGPPTWTSSNRPWTTAPGREKTSAPPWAPAWDDRTC